MTTKEIRELVQHDNPTASPFDVETYVQQFASYIEASVNITQNGTIVSHPRTGQPMENPYVKVRALAEGQLRKIGRIKAPALWVAAGQYIEESNKNK